MEGTSDTSLQPPSNLSLTDAHFQCSSTVGPQTDFAACRRGRKSKETSSVLQKRACNEERYAFPVRPLRRKDSLASQRKEKSRGSSKCSTVRFSDGRFRQSPEAETSEEVVPPHLVKREDAYFSKMPDMQRNTGTRFHVDFPEKSLRSSRLPVPKPRTKKHPSGLFVDEDVTHDVPADCLPTDQESHQQDGQLILPVPLPRAKKRLSASYSASIQYEYGSPIEQNEASLNNTTAILTSNEATEDLTSPNCAVISGGCASIQGGGDCSSEVEREVLAAMAEEFSYSDSQEDKERAGDEIIEGWSLTDQCGVIDHFEQDAVHGLPDVDKVLEDDVDKSFAGDDWLCIAVDKDVELESKNEVKCEEVDFGFVSIDVAAGSLQDER